MKGFIIVKRLDNDLSMCVAVSIIRSIAQTNYGCFIETDFDYKRGCSGFDIADTFDEVMQSLEEAVSAR